MFFQKVFPKRTVTQILFFQKTSPKLGYEHTNDGELAAFMSYAAAFPDTCLNLVDTYDTLMSGVPNFLCVALALYAKGRKPVGVRLDSGDLAYLSRECKRMFKETAKNPDLKLLSEEDRKHLSESVKCCASNDINENTLKSLNEQGHGIDIYGRGDLLGGKFSWGGVFVARYNKKNFLS